MTFEKPWPLGSLAPAAGDAGPVHESCLARGLMMKRARPAARAAIVIEWYRSLSLCEPAR